MSRMLPVAPEMAANDGDRPDAVIRERPASSVDNSRAANVLGVVANQALSGVVFDV
jgi:hypothetical protein